MKTIIKKDLRENLTLALTGLLVFALLLLQAYENSVSSLDNLLVRDWSAQSNTLQPLLSNLLVIEAAFFCVIFGAALGWFQTRNEAHRDLWAFLVHRPVTRTEIFLGKTAAGLALYALGAGLPLAVLILVVWLPGHVAAPFEWPMVLPLGEIFLAGVSGYFAGLLTGLRQARWYGSRGLGAGLAILAVIGVFGYDQYWQSLIGLAVAIGALALAAWGAYQTGGFYARQTGAGKFGLIAVMTVGCSLVLLATAGLLHDLILSPPARSMYQYSSYDMTQAGAIYRVTSHNGTYDQIEDLNGQPLLDPKTGRKMEFKKLQTQLAYGPSVHARHELARMRNPLQSGDAFFTLWNITDKTLWYLDRHGKLVGFDGRTRRPVGTLEAPASGPAPASEPFLIRNSSAYYYNSYNDVPRKFIATATTVFRVDFRERTLTSVLTLTNDEISGCDDQGQASGSYGVDETQDFFFITHKAVYCLGRDGNVAFKVPYVLDSAQYPSVTLSRLGVATNTTNRFALWFYPNFDTNSESGWKLPVHVEWLGTADQGVIKSMDLPALHHETPPDWTDKWAEAMVPPAGSIAEMGYQWWHHQRIHYPHREGVPLAAVCAVTGWLLLRRYPFHTAATMGWTVYVLFFGLPGLMTLLCVQEWPARETCPKCQKLRTVERETCEHCAAPFAPPEKNGTEIFELLTKV